jgi:hypothetical protein
MKEYKLFHLRKFLTSESWLVGKLYFLLAFVVGILSLFYNKFELYAYNKEQSVCETKIKNDAMDIFYTYVYVFNIIVLIGVAIAAVICVSGLLGFLICPLFKFKITKMLAPKDKLAEYDDKYISERTRIFR